MSEEEEVTTKPTPIAFPLLMGEPVGVAITTAADAERETQRAREEARARLESRAARFGIDTPVAPVPGVSVPLERKIRKNPAIEPFATGFDLFSDEQLRKRQERAHKFGLVAGGKASSEKAKEPAPEDDAEQVAKKEARAARFGLVKKRVADEAAELKDGDEKVGDSKRAKKVWRWKLARVDSTALQEPRPDTLYLHGCDRLKTKDVFALTAAYGALAVEWINESSCNVTFADHFTAKRVLHAMGAPEEGSDTWFTLPKGRSMRVATTADVKPVFFDDQTPEERELKKKLLGPRLAKAAGKKANASASRKVVVALEAASVPEETKAPEEAPERVEQEEEEEEEEVEEEVEEEDRKKHEEEEEEVDLYG